MGSAVRLIARLDIKGPNLIKGIQFDGHRVLGDPERFAETYYQSGIDELIFQDTVASLYQRNSLLEIISRVARKSFVPVTVAGGIRSLDDIYQILRAGADKVAINTKAVQDPQFLFEASKAFGSQCIVASIEVYRNSKDEFEVWTDYGRQQTNLRAIDWAQKVIDLGVGEILLTSINKEGTGRGFDCDLISKISKISPIPVIAAGGAGNLTDLSKAINIGMADAVAAASLFHYHYFVPVDPKIRENYVEGLRMGKHIDTGNLDFMNHGYGGFRAVPVQPCSIEDAKKFMASSGIEVRKTVGVH